LFYSLGTDFVGSVDTPTHPPQDGGGVNNTNLGFEKKKVISRKWFYEKVCKLVTSWNVKHLKLFGANKITDKMIVNYKMLYSKWLNTKFFEKLLKPKYFSFGRHNSSVHCISGGLCKRRMLFA